MDNIENQDFNITIPMDELKKSRAGNINAIYWGSRYGGSSTASYNMRLGISWSSTSGSGSSSVTAILWVESAAIQTGSVAKTYTLNINGTSKSESGSFNMGNWNSTFTHKLMENTVKVSHTNEKSITISGSFAINITYAGTYVGTMTHSITASLPANLTAPSAPTWCSASGRYETGEKVNISWGGASGTVSSYDVQYAQYDSVTGWGAWGDVAGSPTTSTSLQQSIVSVGNNRTCLKYRVRAKNSAGTSGWSPESGLIYHYGVKVYENGFKWSTVKVWNGSAWAHARVKVWNGSSWVGAK